MMMRSGVNFGERGTSFGTFYYERKSKQPTTGARAEGLPPLYPQA
jgi:hypothetical protein